MESLLNFCSLLEIPEEVISIILDESKYLKIDFLNLYLTLYDETGVELIQRIIKNDDNGFKILSIMLRLSHYTQEKYNKLGIPISIFIDTFKCFSRFVNEYYESYGYYGFDRQNWVYKQISMKIFRIGELEYEMTSFNNANVINIHIPSDANLNKVLCHHSYVSAKKFFDTYFLDFRYTNFICASWMLSPVLDDLLPSDSNILAFKKDFCIIDFRNDDKAFLKWIFKDANLDYENLPNNTTLQKNTKQLLLNGGNIGSGLGYLTFKF